MMLHRFINHNADFSVRFYQQDAFHTPGEGVIFVFGSNLRGRHGAGAARAASDRYGAIEGQGIGLQGQSYAIPTKDQRIHTLPLNDIKRHVQDFVQFTHNHPELTFLVTPVGTGLAGYAPYQIAPMFLDVINCWLPLPWLPFWTCPPAPPEPATFTIIPN